MRICGNCAAYGPDGCEHMADLSSSLVRVDTTPETPCPIGRFRPLPPVLELEQPVEIVGLREFARELGVTLKTVQRAIDSGRIVSVIETRQGRKLLRDQALQEWHSSRTRANNNRFGDLAGDGMPMDTDNPEVLSPDGLPWGARKTKEEALLAEQRRLKIELERAELDAALHCAADVDAVWGAIVSLFTARCAKIGPAAAASIVAAGPDAARIQGILETAVRSALIDLSSILDPKPTTGRKRPRRTTVEA